MATYKEIRGTHIVSVTSDPPSPVNGQMWYNSTERVVKGFTSSPAGTWATGNDMNGSPPSSINSGGGSNGTQTSGIAVATTNPTPTGETELFNGTSWTEVADLNQARRGLGVCASVNTSAVAFGGEASPNSYYTNNESWNGSSWTEVNNLNAGRVSILAIGSSTAGLAIGGVSQTPANYQKNESWNGTSFTEVGDMNQGRSGNGATAGTQTSGLAWTGRPDYQAYCETWNGSAWTEVGDLNTAKIADGGAGADNTSAISIGGFQTGFTALATTEQWNGTAWTEVNDLSAAVGYQYSGGTTTAGWSAGGYNGGSPGTQVRTELWNSPTTSTVTFTVS